MILNVDLKKRELLGQATGQPSVTLSPRSETEFFSAAADAVIIFQWEKSGEVNGCKVTNGRVRNLHFRKLNP